MRPILYASLWLACAQLGFAGGPAMASQTKKEQATASPKKRISTPKFNPGSSQETPRDRERRLLRECKGRPNAGACLGFAN